MHPLSLFKYCPRCGSGKFVEHNFKSKICETCGFVYYFNSSAATAAFILNADNELLAVRRAREPAKGTLDLPGGFVDMYETAEEAIIREVREETGLTVAEPEFLFSLPNIYVYSGFEVHTVDMFFACKVADFSALRADDDAEEVMFIPVEKIRGEDFGLASIRKAVESLLCKFIFVFILLLSSCKQEQSYYESAGEIFKTGFHIKYRYHRALDDEINDCLHRFDLSLNPFNKQSIIYQVNNNQPVEVDDRFIAVFNKAMEVSEISGGTYDITCAPLINLWGFGYSRMDTVNQAVIDSLKQFVGYKKVHLEGRKVVKDDPRLQLNASSIAKGYSCDVIAMLLESYGITDYMVEIGGEIHAGGKNSKGICWQVEVDTNREVVKLCNQSIATSGNYRNYRIKDGKKYGHTINPLTGYPVESDILSVSVIYPDCMTADAFATAFMTMDLEKALSVANQIPGMNYIFIYVDAEGNLKEARSNPVNVF